MQKYNLPSFKQLFTSTIEVSFEIVYFAPVFAHSTENASATPFANNLYVVKVPVLEISAGGGAAKKALKRGYEHVTSITLNRLNNF